MLTKTLVNVGLLFPISVGVKIPNVQPESIVNVDLLFPSFVGVKIPKCVGIQFPSCVGIKIPNVQPESIWDSHAQGRGVFYVTGSSS
ncbi:hypothetical protein KTGMC3_P1748 [Methanocalculus sp. MC3]